MALNREIFRILFLWVSELTEKSFHLHSSTFNSPISVKICSFEVFNSAVLVKFEVQSANFNSIIFVLPKNLSPISELQLSWSDIYVGEWNRYYCTKTEIDKFQKLIIGLFSKALQFSFNTLMDCSKLYTLRSQRNGPPVFGFLSLAPKNLNNVKRTIVFEIQ